MMNGDRSPLGFGCHERKRPLRGAGGKDFVSQLLSRWKDARHHGMDARRLSVGCLDGHNVHPFEGHQGGIDAVAFSPRDKILAYRKLPGQHHSLFGRLFGKAAMPARTGRPSRGVFSVHSLFFPPTGLGWHRRETARWCVSGRWRRGRRPGGALGIEDIVRSRLILCFRTARPWSPWGSTRRFALGTLLPAKNSANLEQRNIFPSARVSHPMEKSSPREAAMARCPPLGSLLGEAA